MTNNNNNQNTATVTGKRYKKSMRGKKTTREWREWSGDERTAGQLKRREDLLEQFDLVSEKLVGRSAMLVLAGRNSRHSADMFRPVHKEPPEYCSRPQFVVLSVEAKRQLTMTVVESKPRGAKLVYKPVACHDFNLIPEPGATGAVLDCNNPVWLTTANNLLQQLVNTVEQKQLTNVALPQLVLMTDRVKIDEVKLARLAQKIDPPELRLMYAQKRRESAEIMSCGELFADAELVRDAEIAAAFNQQRAYENYDALLGSEEHNPARKVFMAVNPARKILKEANLPADWATSADESLVQSLLLKMREHLPLPEVALDDDLVEGLRAPDKMLKFSASLEQLPSSIIVRAMRATFSPNSALRRQATDTELLEAARNPNKPLIVSAYAKMQLFPTEQLHDLPNYAAGGFFAVPQAQDLQLTTEATETA